MSIRKRVTRNKWGDPVLTITVEGSHDVYRLARHLEHGQVEFADIGRRTILSLRRVLGRGRFLVLDDYFNGRLWKRDAS